MLTAHVRASLPRVLNRSLLTRFICFARYGPRTRRSPKGCAFLGRAVFDLPVVTWGDPQSVTELVTSLSF